MKKNWYAVVPLMIAGMTSLAYADDPKQKGAVKAEKSAAVKVTEVDAKKRSEAKGEKPAESPGWVIIEEDWWTPFVYDFATSTHRARAHYRAREDKAAAIEIDKAVSWLRYARSHADRRSAEDLATAETDLMDYSRSLKSGNTVLAKKLDASFAHASVALGRHHHFRAGKALAEGDMQAAGRCLMAAADLLRNAAHSANMEYGAKAVEVYDDYAPFGYWDDTIVFEKGKLESDLSTIQTELEKLAAKLKSSR